MIQFDRTIFYSFLRPWLGRFLIILVVFLCWILAYAWFPQYRNDLNSFGLLFGMMLYVCALPLSLFVEAESVRASDTTSGLLALVVLVFFNFVLLAFCLYLRRMWRLR